MDRNALRIAFAFILAGTLAAGPLAFAQQSDTPPARAADPHRQAARLSKELSLTADQAAKVEPILADRDQKIAALRANTTMAPADAKQQMRSIQQGAQQQLSNILTPQQFEQLKTIERSRAGKGHAQSPAPPTA
jgi:periplasmic protein CpxP/Spy